MVSSLNNRHWPQKLVRENIKSPIWPVTVAVLWWYHCSPGAQWENWGLCTNWTDGSMKNKRKHQRGRDRQRQGLVLVQEGRLRVPRESWVAVIFLMPAPPPSHLTFGLVELCSFACQFSISVEMYFNIVLTLTQPATDCCWLTLPE